MAIPTKAEMDKRCGDQVAEQLDIARKEVEAAIRREWNGKRLIYTFNAKVGQSALDRLIDELKQAGYTGTKYVCDQRDGNYLDIQ